MMKILERVMILEVSTYLSDNLAVTGSEQAASHKNTYNIDLGLNGKGTRKRYAPFTCVVRDINETYNTISCDSVEKVISPKYPKGEFLCFSVGHRNVMKYKVGQIIRQGEYIGDDGLKGTDELHTHWSFGVGKLKMPNFLTKRGTYKNKSGKDVGIYALACTIGWIHSYDFWFIPDVTPITTDRNNPAAVYPWKRLPKEEKEITIRGKLIKQDGDIYTIKGKEI